MLGHYGERDDFYPADQARAQEEQIRSESGADVTFHYYDAAHAFHNDENTLGTYSEADAQLAWSRTVEFLQAEAGLGRRDGPRSWRQVRGPSS